MGREAFSPEVRALTQALRPEARALLLPEDPGEGLYLEALGAGRLRGLPPVRLRGLEVLVLLLAHPGGLEGRRLARLVYDEENLEALRVEVCRLRGLGLEIAPRPYRLQTPLGADFLELREALGKEDLRRALSLYRGPLLPKSSAPGVEALRLELEEGLRGAVLESCDPELLFTLAQRLEEDLEVWEALLGLLPKEDPRRPLAAARVARLKKAYGV